MIESEEKERERESWWVHANKEVRKRGIGEKVERRRMRHTRTDKHTENEKTEIK
jgi:hypothetical protein